MSDYRRSIGAPVGWHCRERVLGHLAGALRQLERNIEPLLTFE
jgi:hypothetical protein